MSYDVGRWVELVRDVDGAGTGTRGRVTSTGLLGDHDVTTESGRQITGVPAEALRAAPGPAGSVSGGGGAGCALLGLALAGAAAVASAVSGGWWA